MRILVGACAQTAPTFCATEFNIILQGSELATASSRLRRCQQYSNLLRTIHGLTGEDIRADTINEMDLEVRRLGEAIKDAESAG